MKRHRVVLADDHRPLRETCATARARPRGRGGRHLEIIPVFFRFNPHARMEMPLESYDEAAVGKWLDDRIVEFANAYLELHSTKQYQERVMVSDTVAGISFPKYFAAATLDHDGQTYYFISEETRREFAKRHGLTP